MGNGKRVLTIYVNSERSTKVEISAFVAEIVCGDIMKT
jgi:hypothetical protein